MEDFVSFEIAVKLKEKGFNELCTYAYCEQGGWNKYKQEREPITYVLRTDGNPFGSFYRGKNWNVKYETNKNKIRCSAPTISQVLKWLREEKCLHIEILHIFSEETLWDFEIARIGSYERWWNDLGLFDSYEQAALAGIEYCLDNLI